LKRREMTTASGEVNVDMKRRKTDPNPRVVEKLQKKGIIKRRE
jgi:hypothetical protein